MVKTMPFKKNNLTQGVSVRKPLVNEQFAHFLSESKIYICFNKRIFHLYIFALQALLNLGGMDHFLEN